MRWVMILQFVLGVFLLFSCERRPLIDPDDAAMLKVRLVTEGINNVTCNIYNPDIERPTITSDMLRVLIYGPEGQPILSQGFIQNKSVDANGYEVFTGPLVLGIGEYQLLSYNFDLDAVNIQDEGSYNTIKATAVEAPNSLYNRFGSRAEDLGSIFYSPDHVMVARAPELIVEPHTDVQSIELDAYTVVDTYYFQIRVTGIENMAPKAACQAVLTGVTASNCIGPNVRNLDESASLYFELQRSTDPHAPEGTSDNVLCAVFNTFGKIPDAESKMHLTLSVLTRDGETHQKVIDMSHIFESEDARQRHWLLVDDVWEIPTPIESGGGGFQPSVDDWDDIEEFIPIKPSNGDITD